MIRFADSVRLTFGVLRLGNPFSTEELSQLTGLPKRTVRYAIDKLKDKNLLIKYRSLKDMRKIKYKVK